MADISKDFDKAMKDHRKIGRKLAAAADSKRRSAVTKLAGVARVAGSEGPKKSSPRPGGKGKGGGVGVGSMRNKYNAVKNSTNPKRRITTPAQAQKKKRGK